MLQNNANPSCVLVFRYGLYQTRRMTRLRLLFIVSLFVISPLTHSADVSVAVASNFMATAKQLAKDFEAMSGHSVRITTGSSGKLFAQIQHSAPYDVFLSADQDKPAKLIQLGFAAPGSQQTYAAGRLVLASRSHSSEPLSLSLLTNQSIKTLSVANPKLAPYGLAAQQALAELTDFPPRLIKGENISQAYQFLVAGSVDYALVALSQVVQSSGLSVQYRLVPQELHQPIRQDLVLLSHSLQKPSQKPSQNSPDISDNLSTTHQAAQAFIAFILSERGQAIIQAHGYVTQKSSETSPLEKALPTNDPVGTYD